MPASTRRRRRGAVGPAFTKALELLTEAANDLMTETLVYLTAEQTTP